jgi:hypothetical protein
MSFTKLTPGINRTPGNSIPTLAGLSSWLIQGGTR